MRTIVLLALLASWVQDADKPCTLAAVEDAFWCLRCRKPLLKTELEKDRCPACAGVPERAFLCFKEWVPHCGMHDMQPHEKPCCTSPTCCRVDRVAALVLFQCIVCGETAGLESRIVHRGAEHDRKTRKACTRSGLFPHGGVLKK